jgi:hydrogenase maturation protein HypF
MTYHIHIGGLVQGVGFRPHVFRLASTMGMKGWVNNTCDGVHIIINAEKTEAEKFYQELINHPPDHALISKNNIREIIHHEFPDFRIIHSEHHHQPNMMVTPDFGICKECRAELNDPSNQRYNYPFITCTQCGPRYSIISSLPYDRVNTTMETYEMCRSCKEEYHDPNNRRYFSQTNSCTNCGIPMSVHNSEGECICSEYEFVLDMVNEALRAGNIVAVKGIGGYILMADAANRMTIATLRERKHRPGKPFAVIYPSLQKARQDLQINEAEADQLTGPVSPIVLCSLKENTSFSICHDLIAPGLKKIGLMLPYTPLLELISNRFNKPLIATSGNISGSPILFHDEDALEQLTGIADLFLSYERDIVVPQDDSVVQFSPDYGQLVILRRSRGLAPNYYSHPFKLNGCWLATGAELKSSFAILNGEQCYVSQFLGNQGYFDGQLAYKETLSLLSNLLHVKPEFILADSHPGYFVAQEAEKMAKEKEIPCIKVQHHIAHFSAVLAENDLLDSEEPILGIIWDGTGYGDDGLIWGSECFTYSGKEFKRIAHLEYFPSWLRDKMSREPRISAVAISYGMAILPETVAQQT